MNNEKDFKSFTYIIKHEAVMKSGISISTYSKSCIVNVIADSTIESLQFAKKAN